MPYLIIFHSFINMLEGYFTSVKNKPLAGAEGPAFVLSLLSKIALKSCRLVFPVPTSINVPTMARTIFR